MKAFDLVKATSLDEAVSALGGEGAMAIAGGTDVINTLQDRVLAEYPKTLVSLKSIPNLDYIKEEGGSLKIGAMTRLEDIAHNDIVKSKYTCLAEAASKTASPHIRESGTIGGNICQINRCWYFRKTDNRFDCIRKGGNMCYAMAGDNRYHSIFGAIGACIAVNPSDTAPALVSLNATIKTTKRDIAADDFWAVSIPGSTVLEADEVVTEIVIPAFSGKSSFIKYALRKSIDFPVVNCATAISNGQSRICLNAVYNKPYRATAAEEIVNGKTIDEALAEEAGTAAVSKAMAMPATGTNPGNKWKVQIAKTLVKRTILNCK
ncbi:MAG: FAD binding domain-containing protein [Dehalococcoidales bacterium]|jgi:xanthine dehydrogenase YagS FAD-binding subunit|nr:FAD binding domain-containing protein [Dehalococcoidales bacterium]